MKKFVILGLFIVGIVYLKKYILHKPINTITTAYAEQPFTHKNIHFSEARFAHS